MAMTVTEVTGLTACNDFFSKPLSYYLSECNATNFSPPILMNYRGLWDLWYMMPGLLLVNLSCCDIVSIIDNINYIYIYMSVCVRFNNTGSSVSDQYGMRFAGLIWLFGGDTVGHLLNLDKSINAINRCEYSTLYSWCTELYNNLPALKGYHPRSQPQ